MPEGVEVVVEDGFATVTPEPAQRGKVLRALLAAVDHPSQIRTDTSGRRRAYVVLEQDARKAGLLDQRKPAAKKTTVRKAPAKKNPSIGETPTDADDPSSDEPDSDPAAGRPSAPTVSG
ncbi:hypothetical protein [Rhodococcus pyridinivorans]|uniref:Uncharacterized protein n=1 Tax=Rhodococcus pyridinivorans TaxID=103816 RepID=A0A7M2XIC3_9NOCA|nr:hypothetical protein [Rhodococcus pyridinivorans]QOV97163.1 hypothetical protein INP59_14385 [Rhodococcus pyridinivorans]